MQDMEERGDKVNLLKLKGKLTEKEKTYEDCAKALNISIASFNKKMNGASTFKVTEATQLSNFLEMSNEEKLSIFLD